MSPGFVGRCGALPDCMARMLSVAVALLACASVAYGQVIEEGGFPVKGGDVFGESFSLSCSPRLYVAAGEAVSLSCTATSVPEEGIRYAWEAVSGDGLRLLSDAQALAPLFTASLSGAGEEYAYLLTATGAGVYATASVAVTVEGLVQGAERASGAREEECDTFSGFVRDREGCLPWEKAPPQGPFGVPGEEGIVPWPSFPGSPGAEDKEFPGSSDGGPFAQAPPRLECPVAVFLEELETGQVECHAWDASGEEHLEYSWEPVGNTTRDYLENPRLIPEDSPNPSVVAPEAPAYETLESFRSGETTFLYRYRLTATSRATGLSSSSEVEVYVSSSRPSVYCPLEVSVEEGEAIALDCEGADPLSHRMDYDEEGASILWEWEGLWGTSVAPLDATDRSSALFMAPAGSAGEEYHYIASMTSQASGTPRTARRRVTVRVIGDVGPDKADEANVSGAARGNLSLEVTCDGDRLGIYYYYAVAETAPDFVLDCEPVFGPAGAAYTYLWTGNSGYLALLSDHTIRNPVFRVPNVPNLDFRQYLYNLEVSASDGSTADANLSVSVTGRNHILLLYTGQYDRDEGDEDFTFDLELVYDHSLSAHVVADYVYSWEGDSEALARLSATDVLTPEFEVPEDVDADTEYRYVFRRTNPLHGGPDDANISVTVRDTDPPPPSLACTHPDPAYEGSGEFTLDCSVENEPAGATYAWTGTDVANRLSGTNGITPTFIVPGDIDEPGDANKDYEYTVTMMSGGSVVAQDDVTVTVLEKPDITVTCESDLYPVSEGDNNVTLACEASDAPGGDPQYTWSWSPTANLTGYDTGAPTFNVPGDVDRDTTYTYTVTATANKADAGTAEVKVTVRDTDTYPPRPGITCIDPDPVYEGAADFTLDDCTPTNEPSGATYRWATRGSTFGTFRLISINILKPTFDVPEEIDSDKTYDYTVTMWIGNFEQARDDVTVTVLNKGALALACATPSPVYEGSEDFALDCSASGAPAGSDYAYEWTARGGGDTSRLSSTTVEKPTFEVPEEVDSDETYEYTLTVSAENADDASEPVAVLVLDTDTPAPVVTCSDSEVYEGTADITLDCSVANEPPGATYAWTGTDIGNRLSGTDGITPTFAAPYDIDQPGEANKDYEYTVTMTVGGVEQASEDVTVTVLEKPNVIIACQFYPLVYEGSEDFALDCSASGDPSGTDNYNYVWTGRGSTVVPGRLSSTTIAKPTFDVPEEIDSDKTYDYTLTVSADNADSETAGITVTVLNKESLSVVCMDPAPVYEGSANFPLNCGAASGAPAGSIYTYVWEPRGATPDLSLLSNTDDPSPTFAVPEEVDEDETYEYTLTVSAENADPASADVTVTVLNKGALALACADPGSVYEGSEDIAFDCAASGAPGGSAYEYEWTARNGTANTDLLIAGADGPAPTFDVPGEVDEDETYEYLLTVSAENAESARAEVTVKVLNLGSIALVCASPPLVYEGSADFALDCSISGDTGDNVDYAYEWTAIGATPNTSRLSTADIPSPTFYVPDALDETTTYEYLLTASAENAESASAEVTVTVLNLGSIALVCASPPLVYEGSEDFALDCTASGAPGGSTYGYAWTARGSTTNTDMLGRADIASPVFAVPEEVDATTTYEYTLTVSAENAEDATAEVTVTVLNRGALAVICTDPGSVYEGSEDFALDCAVSGAPAGSAYEYEWTARNGTANTDLLIAGADGPAPTFDVPEEVDATTTYEYTLTVSAENADPASADVTVKVLNKGALALACADPGSVYEGSEDFALDCAASGAPGGSAYVYSWIAQGGKPDTGLLSATDIASPTFHVPDDVPQTTTYEYRLRVSAENAESAVALVRVKVLNKGALALVCADPGSVYEGSEDVAFDCEASGAPGGSAYVYSWIAQGGKPDTGLLSATDIASPTFHVPDDVPQTTTYEYRLRVSAENAESAVALVRVKVLNKGALALACADPGSVYEGSEDFAFDCSASGAPGDDPQYTYAWAARGDTPDTALLSAADVSSPMFYVPDEVDEDETYEYTLTVSADNAEDAAAAVTVTVLNKGALALVCADPGSVYEGSEDIAFDCTASGAPGGSTYEYEWTARNGTANTNLLIAGADGPAPTFDVPEEVDEDETYEYTLTVSADNAESVTEDVTVTVLNKGTLALVCADPGSVYEGSEDVAFDCSASGAPAGSTYNYTWEAQGDTPDTSLLSAVDVSSPMFYVPDEVDEDETYEYTLTVSAENAEDASADVTVTVLNVGALRVVCAMPSPVYEGSADIAFDCSASGAPGDDPQYTYAWTARGDTPDTALLSAADIASPTFAVPDEVDEDETYEYLLTASADNAEDAAAEVSVTVLNKGALSIACADPGSVYEGSEDTTFDCSASGAPGDDPQYTYAWTARGDTPDTSLLSAADVSSPMFYVPDEVDEDETYEYLLTVSAENAEDAKAEVTVTVLDRIRTPAPDPVSPPAEEPPVAGSSSRAPSDPTALGVTVSASSLRFGVQSAQTRASLDPMTDQISTRVSGPYHAGRMTLSPGGGASFDENGEMDLSIEVVSPVLLKREGAAEPSSLVLSPSWSFAESCEQLSSQAIGGLYTEATLTEGACRLLRFGGELDLTDAPSGRYAGSMDIVLRSGESEETHSVEVEVTVVPSQRVITIGPGGVRFSTSRELAAGLTEEQNLSIYPDVAFLTEGKPHGVFELSNPSLIPLEVSVSARFGYTEATRDGREVVVEDASDSRLGDLSQVVDIHPAVVVLQPGEKGLVRYGVKEGALAAMAEQGYAAFFDVVSSPRQYVRSDRMPEEVTGERTARVTMRVPGVYVPGEGASQLRATLLSLSYGVSMSATFLLETEDRPFAGEVVAYDGDGRELGRRETLVYTRSRVRVPLARMPEEEVVFLRFAPWGSSRVPEPTSVEWNAPGRDIGAAGEKERRTTPKSALQ